MSLLHSFRYVAAFLIAATFAPGAALASDLPQLQSLEDQVGEAETVDLDVYFIGFPNHLKSKLRKTVEEKLDSLQILDAKDWWIPNLPMFGEDFARAPAPEGLPEELIPPGGEILYDPNSMHLDPNTGLWMPVREIDEVVDELHETLDIVNHVNHDGAYTNVRWEPGEVDFHFLPESELAGLRAQLEASRSSYSSTSPASELTLYSYNELFDWLEASDEIRERRGGATLVFINLPGFADEPYTFYAEPDKDLVPAVGLGAAEKQFAPATATTPELQGVADLMTGVLGGGLTQAKMLAAVELECADRTTAGAIGMDQPPLPFRSEQSICAQWTLDPIPNLLGNAGRRYFVSDATRELAALEAGSLSDEELLESVERNFFELYRYGILQPNIKANSVYSEAYELRILQMDLRYSSEELCILGALQALGPDATAEEITAGEAAAAEYCAANADVFPHEMTYEVSDVFDVELARKSLSEMAPAHWDINLVPFPFGLQPDGTVSAVASAKFKAFLRTFLNEPSLPDGTSLPHTPLYRDLTVPDGQGGFTEISSSWEHGLDQIFTTLLMVNSAEEGGLGLHEMIWPDAIPAGERPYHETGKPGVKPMALFLTPAPGGPTGELWGTFPTSLTAAGALSTVMVWGGGSIWISTGGNEGAGGFYRRDFLNLVPQYILGPNRGNGSATPMGVYPDGTVQQLPLNSSSVRALDFGAPHWCNEFDSEDAVKREACRQFVRSTTTLQSIETLQHGMGYMHAPEPRKRYHYDGETSSVGRLYELLASPDDVGGHLLHNIVNQYTTAGVSTVWGQITSEWNGVGPSAGMQASLLRSHVREEVAAAEAQLAYAEQKLAENYDPKAALLLHSAVAAHSWAVRAYDDWEYKSALGAAQLMLSLIDKGLTELGEPDRIQDPLELSGNIEQFKPRAPAPGLDDAIDATGDWSLEEYEAAAKAFGGH